MSGFTIAQTRTYSVYNWNKFGMPLSCDGVDYDYVEGYYSMHTIVHIQKGEYKWFIFKCNATLKSNNGEVLKINDTEKWDITPIQPQIQTFHFNIIGDRGSHYIAWGTYNRETQQYTFDRIICPQNN